MKYFYTNRKRCEVLTRFLSLGCRPGDDWANMWIGIGFFSIPFKEEVVAAPVTDTFFSLSFF